jgi:hypothetical protein
MKAALHHRATKVLFLFLIITAHLILAYFLLQA